MTIEEIRRIVGEGIDSTTIVDLRRIKRMTIIGKEEEGIKTRGSTTPSDKTRK